MSQKLLCWNLQQFSSEKDAEVFVEKKKFSKNWRHFHCDFCKNWHVKKTNSPEIKQKKV